VTNNELRRDAARRRSFRHPC